MRGRNSKKTFLTPFKKKKFESYFDPKTFRIDYKCPRSLSSFLTENGKIIPRRVTGISQKQQFMLKKAIEHARQLALIPYPGRHISRDALEM